MIASQTGNHPPKAPRRYFPTASALCWLLAVPLQPATLGPRVSCPALYAIRCTGVASYYLLEGCTQANGKPHRGRQLTAAHRTLPLGSVRTLCRVDHPLVCAQVVVTDRFGRADPGDRQWDVSRAVAHRLGMLRAGLVAVTVQE